MCVNYGGRAELADAARAIAREVAAGRLNPDKIDERTFARHLYVPEQSDADLVWRTSGEQRLSNFMLWQAAYSELVFTDVLWPDVDRRAPVGRDRDLRPPRPALRRRPRLGAKRRRGACAVTFSARSTRVGGGCPGGVMGATLAGPCPGMRTWPGGPRGARAAGRADAVPPPGARRTCRCGAAGPAASARPGLGVVVAGRPDRRPGRAGPRLGDPVVSIPRVGDRHHPRPRPGRAGHAAAQPGGERHRDPGRRTRRSGWSGSSATVARSS